MPVESLIEQALKAEQENQLDLAIDLLEQALILTHDDARIPKHLARLSLRINEIRAFSNWCHEALRIDDTDPEPHLMLANHLSERGRKREAEEEYRMAEHARLKRMQKKLRIGVLGASKFALNKSVPAMQRSELTEVVAVASRDLAKAQAFAQQLNIPTAYGSYEELLADPNIDAIYNPLPNHMHVEWSIRSADAGKHVLCEKPLALTAAEIQPLIEARDRNKVQIAEAFMVRVHPQWVRTKEIVDSREIGDLRSIQVAFSYFNADPQNIRNKPDIGGGAIYDIGCYAVFVSRSIFGSEPRKVIGLVEKDPALLTDRLSSAILDFKNGQAVFTCSTQLVPYQRVQILGTKGRIDVEIPFNAPPDQKTRIFVDIGGALDGSGIRTETFNAVDQYTLQGDAFARAVAGKGEVPVSLEESVENLHVLEAIFRSVSWGRWEVPGDIPANAE